MAIPKYNELYRLVLLSLQDGGTHSMKEVRDFIISTLHLTEQDLAETLPSNPKSSVFSGRVGWAKTYLLKAQMIDSPPTRAHFHNTFWKSSAGKRHFYYQHRSRSKVPRISGFLSA